MAKHPNPPATWLPADRWAAERGVTASQFIRAAQADLPLIPAKTEDGVVLVDTARAFAWLQLLELLALRPDSHRAVTAR